MGSPLLNEIVANFRLQLQLYEEMQIQAERQRQVLQNGPMSAEINPILDRRREVMLELEELNSHNRELQARVLKELEIRDFTLSELKKCVDDEGLYPLESLIEQLGQVLHSITAIDEDNQRLMSQRRFLAARAKKSWADPQGACQAYVKAAEQNKDRGRKKE